MSKLKKLTVRAKVLKKLKELTTELIETGKEMNKLTPEDKEWVVTKFERLSIVKEFEGAFGNKSESNTDDDLPF